MTAGFQRTGAILCADGVPLSHIAQACGTPCYVYSAEQLELNIYRLKKAFADHLPAADQPLIAYACKANSNLAVLSCVARQGLGADVVSGGELLRARESGIDAARIVYSGVGKSDEDIKEAIRQNVAQINIESEPEFHRIADIAKDIGITARIAFRLNPDVDAKTHAKITTGKEENKFGLPAQGIMRLYKEATNTPFIEAQGISVHIGSQLTSLEPFEEAFKKTAAFIHDLRAQSLIVKSIDLGGGLGIVYQEEQAPCLDHYARLVRDIIHPLATRIIIEPGRLLVGDAGLLLTKILYIKETESRSYMILDGGMNDLVRPAMYDAWHAITSVVETGQPEKSYDIVGPICETGDTFAKDRMMPEMAAGDLVAVMTAGAYGFVMASRYNTRPLPPEIMTRGGHFRVVRQKENIQAIIKEDIIPDW
ncbi:MAG: diaminopimelate decarboxylase [Micavibrio sp.]